MRWDNIDLLKKKENVTELPDYSLVDRTTDAYLADKLGLLNPDDYRLAKELLTVNPFNYLISEKTTKGIDSFDQFCIKYQGNNLSIGGLLIKKDLSNQQKNKIVKKELKNWSEDFIAEQRGKIKDISNKMDVLNSLKLTKLPFGCLFINFLLLIILFVIVFPTKRLLSFDKIINILNMINNNNLFKTLKIICFSISLLSFLLQIFFNIFVSCQNKQKKEMEKQIKVLNRDLKKRMKSIIKILNKQYCDASKKVKKRKYQPLLLKDLKRQQQELNLNHLVEDYLTNLTKIKRFYKSTKTMSIIIFILSNILNVTFIALMISKLL